MIFEKDTSVHDDVVRRINLYLSDKQMLEKQVLAQDKFIESLGENGTNKCLNIINDYINQKNKKI
jgi:hypothetical protein